MLDAPTWTASAFAGGAYFPDIHFPPRYSPECSSPGSPECGSYECSSPECNSPESSNSEGSSSECKSTRPNDVEFQCDVNHMAVIMYIDFSPKITAGFFHISRKKLETIRAIKCALYCIFNGNFNRACQIQYIGNYDKS